MQRTEGSKHFSLLGPKYFYCFRKILGFVKRLISFENNKVFGCNNLYGFGNHDIAKAIIHFMTSINPL
jgi:hypothetical protein